MQAAKVLIALCIAALVCGAAHAGYDWEGVLNKNKMQTGDATYYGQQVDQDEAGTCSFGRNFANTMKMPWTSDVRHSVALNDNMFNDSLPCGTCIMYRGTGQGLGTTPIPTTNWTKAIVNNRCPECSFGDVDLNLNGDGRWKIEWHAVPCNVGDSKLKYSIVVSTYYWFSLVVSNTRIPVAQVQVKINDVWVNMKRANNNQWPYYNTNGPWQTGFPMPIRVTSIAGETVEDVITSPSGGDGNVQFSPDKIVHPQFQDAAASGGWSYAANVTGSGSGNGSSSGYVPGATASVAFSASGSNGQSGAGGGGGSSGSAPAAAPPSGGSSSQSGSGQSGNGGGSSSSSGQGSGSGGDNKQVASASVPTGSGQSGSAPAPAPAQQSSSGSSGQSSGQSNSGTQLSVGTPAPTAAGSRKEPSSEQYSAVGGRRLLRT